MHALSTHTAPTIQRRCAACEQEDVLQRQPLSQAQGPILQKQDQPGPRKAAPPTPKKVPATAPVKAPAPTIKSPCPTLSWSNFRKSRSIGGFDAITGVSFDYDSKANTCQAKFSRSKSWVTARYKNPNPQKLYGNKIPKEADCTNIRKYNFEDMEYEEGGRPTPDTCPTLIYPDKKNITTVADCKAFVAHTQERANQESARLLHHEQYHMRLGCALADKGNVLLTAGKKWKDVNPKLIAKQSEVREQYDKATEHGCKATEQTAWEAKIDAGLPGVSL